MEYGTYLLIAGGGMLVYSYIISPIVNGINHVREYLPETLITDDTLISKRVVDIISKKDTVFLYLEELKSRELTDSQEIKFKKSIDNIILTLNNNLNDNFDLLIKLTK